MGKYLRQIAMHEIRRLGPQLKPGPGLALVVIADWVRDDIGILWAGERKVAERLGRSQSTYRGWRADLVRLGLMKQLGIARPGVATRWEVLPNEPESERRGQSLKPEMTDEARDRIDRAQSERSQGQK